MDLIRLGLTTALVCLLTKQVSAGVPMCDPINLCNGDVTYSSQPFLPGVIANASCDTGYTLTVSNITCISISNTRGIWMPEEPACEVNECDSITLDHGTVSYTHGTEYSSTASFTCESGYKLSGEASVTCQDDENWSDAIPTCESGAGLVTHSVFLITTSLVLLFLQSV